jgi:excisionase family DNA binding protein
MSETKGTTPLHLGGRLAPEVATLADGCFSIAEAARFSGLSRSTLYEAMESGLLPFVKIGRRRLVPRRALVEWLASGLRGGQRP